jgi:PAS domain S-box-containing protein
MGRSRLGGPEATCPRDVLARLVLHATASRLRAAAFDPWPRSLGRRGGLYHAGTGIRPVPLSDNDGVASNETAVQLPVELILLRQAASYLRMPIFLVDADGRLVYFNEPAEPLLGSRFDEVGEMSMEDWLTAFRPTRRRARRLVHEEVPVVVALRTQRPVHATLEITGLDGVRRPVEVTALPLEGPEARLLGAIAIFWPSNLA